MTTETLAAAKRPKLVWVVFLFYIVSVGYTALSFVLIFAGVVPMAPAQATYFKNLSLFDWAITALLGLFNVAAAIAIFQLRKVAVYLFTASLALMLLQTLMHVLTTNFLAALSGAGTVGLLIGYAILIAVCLCAWRLKARGVLV